MDEILDLDLCAAAARVAAGAIRPSELTEAALRRIEGDPEARRCFLRLDAVQARERARRLDAATPSGALHGLPLANKDLFSRPGVTVTMSAHPDFHLRGGKTAPVLAALDAAGGVDLGGLHLSEFAMGPAGWSAQYGFLANPRDGALVTGGSSSGSAAAVARRLVFGALGTDTGGSIRIPAAFCGIVGLKPTAGLLPLAGCFPVSQSLDTIGPLARTVRDCARLFDVIAGNGGACETAVEQPARLRYGILDPSCLPMPPEPAVAAAFAAGVARLEAAGLPVVPVRIDTLAELASLCAVVFLTEAGAVHAHRLATARERIGPQVAERLLQGLAFPGSLYLLAREARQTHLARLRAEVFDKADVLLLPTAPVLPPRREAYDALPDTGAILDFNARLGAYTPAFSYLGVPALSMPFGGPLGFGLQLVADSGREAVLLAAARGIERIA